MAEPEKTDPVDVAMWIAALVLFVVSGAMAAFLFGWFGGFSVSSEAPAPSPTVVPSPSPAPSPTLSSATPLPVTDRDAETDPRASTVHRASEALPRRLRELVHRDLLRAARREREAERQSSGQTPARLEPLEPGPYEVTIEYEGFPLQTRTVDVRTGALHSLKVRFGAP